MTHRDRATFLLDTAARWRIVTSPARQVILQLLEDGASWTVRELADRLGRDPHALYPHVDVLAGAGFVVADASDGPTRYRLVGKIVPTGFRVGEPFAALYATVVDRMLKQAARIHAVQVQGADPWLRPTLQTLTLNLTAREAKRLQAATARFHDEVHALLRSPAREGSAEERRPFHVVLGVTVADAARHRDTDE